MKLKTSYSKLTSFRKDITRFSPLWIIYFVGGMLVMLTLCSGDIRGETAREMTAVLPAFSVINLIYAGLCANLLFGDLFNARLCNAMHAMPMRREHWFVSHVGAGLCFSLVPHGVAVLILMTRLGEFWYVGLLWMAVMALEFLFFFGVAVLSCMCAGSRFAMVVVYGIINFFSMIALWFCTTVYFPLLYGVEVDTSPFIPFSPVVKLAGAGSEAYVRMKWAGSLGMNRYVFERFGDGWGYLAILAVLGVVALAAALVMYRRRKLECAGDFIAVKFLEPVFLVVYTLCFCAVFSLVGELFKSGTVVYMIVGFLIGFFTGSMLLKRTVKVFRPKTFIACGILAAVLFGSVAVVSADPLGIISWTPEAGNVESASIRFMGTNVTSKEEGKIREIIAVHRAGIDQRYVVHNYSSVDITYEMKDGTTVKRSYYINETTAHRHKELFSSVEALLGRIDAEAKEGIKGITISDDEHAEVFLSGAEAASFLDAVLADCREGNLLPFWVSHSEWEFDVYVEYIDEPRCPHFTVFRDGKNTIAWMENYWKEHPTENYTDPEEKPY